MTRDSWFRRLGAHGLRGWRARFADVAAPRVAAVTPAREEDVRPLIGLAFVVLSLWYVGAAFTRFIRGR